MVDFHRFPIFYHSFPKISPDATKDTVGRWSGLSEADGDRALFGEEVNRKKFLRRKVGQCCAEKLPKKVLQNLNRSADMVNP